MSVPSAEMIALNNQLKLLTEGIRNLAAAQSHSVKDTYTYSETVRKANYSLEDLEESFKKRNTSNKHELRAQKELLQAKKNELELLKKLEKDKVKQAAELAKIQADFQNRIINSTQYLEQTRAANANVQETIRGLATSRAEIARNEASLSSFGGSLGGATRFLNIFAGALSFVANMIVGANKTFMDATVKSSGVIEGVGNTFDDSMGKWMTTITWATGVETARALEIMAINRQVVNSLGGIDNAINLTKESVTSMRGFYSSLEESLKENMGILTSFGQKGIKPSERLLQEYNKDLTQLSKQTGLAATEINKLYNSIASDSDLLSTLRAVREDEREAILANQRALLSANVALGMTAEQATDAAKMLNKMVAQKPLERFKQAAKLRALGAFMGVDTSAASAELMKPKGQQNLATINEALVNLSTQMGTSAQQGIVSEIATSTITEKLGFEELQQTFDTNLKAMAMSQEEIAAMYQTSSQSQVVKLNTQIELAQAMLSAITQGTLFGGLILQAVDTLAGPLRSIKDANVNAFRWWTTKIGDKVVQQDSSKPAVTKEGLQKQIDQDTLTAQYKRQSNIEAEKNADLQKRISEARTNKEKESFEKQLAIVRNKQADDLHNYQIQMMKVGGELPTARALTPNEATTVKLAPDHAKEGVERANNDKAEGYMSDQVNLAGQQVSKIDEQLKQMTSSNEFLKTITDNTKSLLDISEKQLAVSTMTQEQKNKAASRLGSEFPKFNADYSYSL